MLFLYGKITRYRTEKDPRINRLILQDWLNVHDVRLPSANELIKEMNIQSSHITPVEIGEQWTELKVESLLLNTSLPEFEILNISEIETDKISVRCCVQWPECMPGVEVSIMLRGEKIITHLQVDWMYMLADVVLSVEPLGVLSISWEQVQPTSSALSCLVMSPDHWRAKLDITKHSPTNDPELEASENLSSSVAEGILALIKNFKMKNFKVPHEEETDIEKDKDKAEEERVEKEEETNEEKEEVLGEKSHELGKNREDVVKHVEEIEQHIEEDKMAEDKGDKDRIENHVAVEEGCEDNVIEKNDSLVVREQKLQEIPIITVETTESTRTNGHSPNNGSLSRRWQNDLPVITEPEKEEYTPPPAGIEDEDNQFQNTFTTPSWRRDSYEHLENIVPNTPPPARHLPSYLTLSRSNEDLTRAGSINDNWPFHRSMTLSMRSYDTDAPVTENGRFLSTLVFEIKDNDHKRHIVATDLAQANRLRKQLNNYTKLHIYNDHTFIAIHIKGKQTCLVCYGKITGLFGKQAYCCRDCGILVHKTCHHKIENSCLKSKTSKLNLIYPDVVSSISTT